MLYDIALRITQHYDSPAAGARQVARLVPPTIAGEQDVIAAVLDVEPPPDERRDRQDFFGNGVVEVAYRAAQERIEFRLTARVRRHPVARSLLPSPGPSGLAAAIARVHSLSPDAPHHFLPPSPRVPVLAELAAYAREVVPPGCPVLEAELSGSQSGQIHRNNNRNDVSRFLARIYKNLGKPSIWRVLQGFFWPDA